MAYRNIAENFNRLSRAHERYRRQTDRRTDDSIGYSERDSKFTFTKKDKRKTPLDYRRSINISVRLTLAQMISCAKVNLTIITSRNVLPPLILSGS